VSDRFTVALKKLVLMNQGFSEGYKNFRFLNSYFFDELCSPWILRLRRTHSTPRRKSLCGLLNTLLQKSRREIPPRSGANQKNPLLRKAKILTTGILVVFRGLKSEPDAEIGESSHLWMGIFI
jgi:hypothetical protein